MKMDRVNFPRLADSVIYNIPFYDYGWWKVLMIQRPIVDPSGVELSCRVRLEHTNSFRLN